MICLYEQDLKECIGCGRYTRMVDLDFQSYLCIPCQRVMTIRYMYADFFLAYAPKWDRDTCVLSNVGQIMKHEYVPKLREWLNEGEEWCVRETLLQYIFNGKHVNDASYFNHGWFVLLEEKYGDACWKGDGWKKTRVNETWMAWKEFLGSETYL